MSASGSAFRVVIGATNWAVNGVNVFSANLTRGLRAAGIPAHILLTEDRTMLVELHETLMPYPADLPFVSLPVSPIDGWGQHWGATVRYLEEAAPCVYIPNYDWRHSCICPRLSNDVVVVGVVHSDDPLHYDHVRRLGPYWNAVVAVSSAVAERTADACPPVADRIVTIPIGVRLPQAWPPRARTVNVLRLVYHGALKQHQKRVLDLVGIVESASHLGVPVELSIAGSGPDEAALRTAAAPLVARGLIRFLGVISPDDTAAMLETQDVYLLPSEFEGMPNALIEAMGRGCVPIVTRTTSGIPELIQDGDNGFLVPVGDTAGFAEHLRTLWTDSKRRRQMSKRAFQTAGTGRFRVDDMIRSYQEVFESAWQDVREGRFARATGPIAPPPQSVAGVPLFPVSLEHTVRDIGTFPSVEDAEDYALQVEAVCRTPAGAPAIARAGGRVTPSPSLDGVTVIVSTPRWTDNGVNLWSEDLVRGLREARLDARLLLTEETTALAHSAEARLARPSDLPFDELLMNGDDTWGARWGAVIRTLEQAAPCLYFPTHDVRQSSVVPALSNRVAVIGTIHDSGSFQTKCAGRLGAYWNAAVALSVPIARDVRREWPRMDDRLTTIPQGMSVPAALVEKPVLPDGAVTVLIIGTVHDEPGDAYWMETLARALAQDAGRFRIVVVDPAPSLGGRLAGFGAKVVSHANRQEWLALCRNSRYAIANNLGDQAKRAKMVEAMGHGCIPVSMRSEPTDDPLVLEPETVIAPSGEWQTVVERIREVAADPDRQSRMAVRAHRTARTAGYRTDQMIDWYLELCERVMREAAKGWFQRPRGLIMPPPAQVDGQILFPSELTHHTSHGTFPSPRDAERFREEAGLSRSRSPGSWR